MDYFKKIITDIELHSVTGIADCFENGVSPNAIHNNKPLLFELISEYTRTPRFKDCVDVFISHGLIFPEDTLLAVLLDDSTTLESIVKKDNSIVTKKYTLPCAYTPLDNVTLLHICAEFNHVSCAKVLFDYGADINAKAGTDENGFGGHTPVFHTVNQNDDNSAEMLDFLLEHSADLLLTVPGIVWGEGYPWETLIPSVNPISYAMMGLLPQMHRNEITISKVVTKLLKAAYGISYQPANVPCAYLQ